MPRKNPMPEREQQICSRLRVFRESTKLTRAAFAREIGVDPLRLASYELGRAPVRFDLAWRVKEKFHLSLVWLFKEVGNMRGNYAVSAACVPTPDMLFSKAYEFYIGQALIDAKAGLHEFPNDEILFATVAKGSKLSGLELDSLFDRLKTRIPKRIWPGFRASMDQCAAQAVEYLRKGVLTHSETHVKTAAVKPQPQLPILLDELKKATAEPGKKSALAKFLGAPLASVSRWLSGEREPGGEITLRMRYWLDHPGLQK